MQTVRTIDARGRSEAAVAELVALRRPLAFDPLADEDEAAQSVRRVIAAVRDRGDEALVELNRSLEGADTPAGRLRVAPAEIEAARRALPGELRDAIRLAIENLRRYQRHALLKPPQPIADRGRELADRYRPLRRVAVWTPGASAPLPSTTIHCAVPAQVAGVPEIVLLAPPRVDNDIHPVTLGVAGELGLSEVYRVGGTHGVAAAALGTATIRRVDKIVGPGSRYVQLAKKFLFGLIDVESFAGPSELIVIADASADPVTVAVDLLAQAEHDPGMAVLVALDEALAATVVEELPQQAAGLARGEQALACMARYGAVVLVASREQAAEVTDAFAPEHLHIQTDRPAELADAIDCAGAIFLGPWTPESAGDYVAGPSHVLPTGGTARFFSALSANDFMRHTSVLAYNAMAIREDAAAIAALAEAEGLSAHAEAARRREARR